MTHKIKVLAELYHEADKAAGHFENGIELTAKELHLLEIIGDQPGRSVTALAHSLGITKGAISQILQRLDRKGMIQRNVDPGNSSRAALDLSSPGQSVYAQHKLWHQKQFDGGLLALMQEYSETEGVFLDEAMNRFIQVLQGVINLNPTSGQ